MLANYQSKSVEQSLVGQSIFASGAPTGLRMFYVLRFPHGKEDCRILEKETCLEWAVLIFSNICKLLDWNSKYRENIFCNMNYVRILMEISITLSV